MTRILAYAALLLTIFSCATAQQSQHLDQFLQPDGTLNIPAGFSGSFKVRGWKMQTGSNGTPRFTQTTSADPSWDADFESGDSHINGDVRAVAVIGNDVYIAGAFTSAINGTVNHIVRWNESGWYSLGTGVNATVYALAVIGTDLYVGGDFSSPSNCIVKWNGASWSSLGSGTDGTVYSLATDGINIYAGGLFGSAGGVGASRIAKWNGSSWSALGSGTTATVTALTFGEGSLYAGGYFSTAGGVTVNQIARWDGSWHSLGTGLDGNVSALAASGGDIYVGQYPREWNRKVEWNAVGQFDVGNRRLRIFSRRKRVECVCRRRLLFCREHCSERCRSVERFRLVGARKRNEPLGQGPCCPRYGDNWGRGLYDDWCRYRDPCRKMERQ